jgi:hypothetical protein
MAGSAPEIPPARRAPAGGGLAAAIVLGLMALPSQARAGTLWNWSYVNADAKITASGAIVTTDQSAGHSAITSISGLWNGGAITGLEPVKTCCSPPGWNDNLLVDGDPKLDKGGFAFRTDGGVKVNLFYKDGRYAFEIENGSETIGGAFVAVPAGAP